MAPSLFGEGFGCRGELHPRHGSRDGVGNPSLATPTSRVPGRAGELLKARTLQGALNGRLKGWFGIGEGWPSASRGTAGVVQGQITALGLSCTDSPRSRVSGAAHRDAPVIGRVCPKAEEATKTHGGSSPGYDLL